MPSPFPGMDPYLEGPRWMGVHGQLIAEIARLLAPRLRPKYVAVMGERVVIEMPPETPTVHSRSRYPDVSVVATEVPGSAVAATTLAAAPLRLATAIPEAVPHYSVEIRLVSDQRLITAIEVLSPTNKRGEGYEEYLNRRRRLLLSDANLMEIDLLRNGSRVPMLQPLPAAPYFVFLSRTELRPLTDVWPISMRERLPVLPVPLAARDADVSLDLQQALSNVYDAVGYDLLIDYSQPPPVPLAGPDADWARQLTQTA